MASIIVGDRSISQALAQTLEAPDTARIWEPPAAAPDPEAPAVGELAQALAALETDLSGQEFDAVLLADDSEAALAGALVATKLLLEVSATERARNPHSANGRAIIQLTDAYTGRA